MRIIKSGSSDPPSHPHSNSPFIDHLHALSLALGSDDSFHQEALQVQGSSTSSRKSNILHTLSQADFIAIFTTIIQVPSEVSLFLICAPHKDERSTWWMVPRLLLHSLVSPLFILLQSASIVSWYQKLLLRYWLPSNVRLVCDSCNFPGTLDGKAKLLSGDIDQPLPEYTTNKKRTDSLQPPRPFCIISMYEDWHPTLVKCYFLG